MSPNAIFTLTLKILNILSIRLADLEFGHWDQLVVHSLPPAYAVRRRLYFYWCLSVNTGRVPQFQVLSQVSGHRSLPREYPSPGQGVLQSQLGYPSPPGQDWGTPLARTRAPPPRPGLGCPLPRDRTAERVLAMQRAVRLLLSRR